MTAVSLIGRGHRNLAGPRAGFPLALSVILFLLFWSPAYAAPSQLASGGSVSPADGARCIGLAAAAKAGNVVEVRRLLACGADPNSKGERQGTPLFWAVMSGSTEVARVLIAHGAEVNAPDEDGFTALHAAAYWSRKDIAELLVANGADTNAKGTGGWTPLLKALEKVLTCAILATVFDPRDIQLDAANAGAIASYLISHGASVTAAADGGETSLHFVAAAGNVGLLQVLLERGAPIDAANLDGVTPLYAATRYHHLAAVRLLLDKGADVDRETATGLTPLMWAAYTGNFSVSDLLVAHGASTKATDQTGESALYWALASASRFESAGGRQAHAEWLAQLNEEDQAVARYEQSTMKKQWRDVALMLIEHGADVNASRSMDPTTLLNLAANIGDARIVRALVNKGAALNPSVLVVYESPLHAAIAERHKDVAEILVLRGADVNSRNRSDRTPLHVLARDFDDSELAELMIQHGALVNAEDKNGDTPLDFALRAGHLNVARVLQERGGLSSDVRVLTRVDVPAPFHAMSPSQSLSTTWLAKWAVQASLSR